MTVNQFIITGIVKSVVTNTTSGGKQFAKILLSVNDERNNGTVEMPVELTAWGKAFEAANSIADGCEVAIAGKVSGRQHEGRVYCDLTAISIKAGKRPQAVESGADSCPF